MTGPAPLVSVVQPAAPARRAGRCGDTRAQVRLAAGVAIALGLGALAFHALDLGAVRQALAQADLGLAALSALVASTICILASSARLWLFTTPLPSARRVGFWAHASAYYASCAVHQLVPGPAAEVVRTVHLHRRYGYSAAGLVAAQLVERLVDGGGLAAQVLVVALAGGFPRALEAPALIAASAALAGVAGAAILARRVDGPAPASAGRVRTFIADLAVAMRRVGSRGRLGAALALSIVNDLANAASAALALAAAGLETSLAASLLVVIVGRFVGFVPSAPGQLGVVEGGVVLVLGHLGVSGERALAAGLLYHAAHFVPITLFGLWELKRFTPSRT